MGKITARFQAGSAFSHTRRDPEAGATVAKRLSNPNGRRGVRGVSGHF